ncbi:MAG: HAD hydrolase family protein, partial [Planctomycetota bacterium]|nr:HAD hydrolase family protein [Planctomycetota bacterium]
MARYLFFTDVDGTLLRGDMAIPERVKIAAKRFVDAGGLLTLCTGRAPLSTAWIAKALDIGLPCILYGGAALYDFGRREIVSGRALPAGTGERCAEVLSRFPTVSLQAYGAENIFMLRITDLLRAKGVR